MFEVKNIAFAYGGRQVLRDVSFVLSPGETVGVVGANGAGKTTLLKILATVLVPDAGTVMLAGRNLLATPGAYRRTVGYMPEGTALYEDMTVKEYLVYRARMKGEASKRIRRRVEEAVEMCRLSGELRARIGGLSFGQKRRVALADAILLRPRVLLLDDFLAGLDAAMRDDAGRVLSEAAAFSAVVVTGHDIADLARWTTRFVVLGDGRVADVVPSAGADAATAAERVLASIRGVSK